MQKLAILALITLTITGCTSYAGMSKTEKPGSYYILTNKSTPFGIRTGALLCTEDGKNGNLDCRNVKVDEI